MRAEAPCQGSLKPLLSLPVIETHHIDGRALAELVAQLGRIVYGVAFVGGLTPPQWTALRYFARANRFSRRVSAFADFHATTRGSASQTVKNLLAQGYLARTPSQTDGRSARIDLTEKGERVLTHDPFEVLVRAATALPNGARTSVGHNLQRMLGHVASERHKPPFGVCPNCMHFRSERCLDVQSTYACALAGEPLSQAEIGQLCVNFRPGEGSAMKRTFDPPILR
jgi:DNA-binding MarR family transcriptional regulator